MEQIQEYEITDTPNSSFIIVNSRRRSGKTVLVEDIVRRMKENNMIDTAILFSKTNSGLKNIPHSNRFEDIDELPKILRNVAMMNEFNKCCCKEDKFHLKMAIILDDFAVNLKDKNFSFLSELSVNGRHLSYEPLSVHIILISQSFTKIPRVVRIQADLIIFSQISSRKEQDLILDEAFYILDGSLAGRREGRDLYNKLATSDDYVFIVVEQFREGKIRSYADYIKITKADINKIQK